MASEAEEKVLRRQPKFQSCKLQPPRARMHACTSIAFVLYSVVRTIECKGWLSCVPLAQPVIAAEHAYLSNKRFNLNKVLFTHKIAVELHNICRLFRGGFFYVQRSFMPSTAVKPGSGFLWRALRITCDCKNASLVNTYDGQSVDYLHKTLAVQGVLLNWVKLETIVESTTMPSVSVPSRVSVLFYLRRARGVYTHACTHTLV